MKCKIGDKVRFLNDVGGGIVTRIIDKRTVAVETQDGFEIPVLDSEVVIIGQGDEKLLSIIPDKGNTNTKISISKNIENKIVNKSINDAYQNQTNREENDPSGNNIGLYLAFVPKDDHKPTNSELSLYIINDSDYRLFYSISTWKHGEVEPIKSGILVPDSKELIRTYMTSELNNQFVLNIQSLFFKNTNFVPQQPEFSDININPVKLSKESSFVDNDFFDEKAYVISIADTKKEELLRQITDEAISNSIKQKDGLFSNVKEKKVVKPEIEEVDLHINELVDNSKDMSPGEIIQIQLARFETALEGGLKNSSTRKMVFIHGLGNGKLKLELRKLLDKKYQKLKYQDASFQEYGYGATLVYIR